MSIFRLSRSIPEEWIITAIITSVGALAHNTAVKVTENFIEPVFLYSVIAGLPSTKKSRCVRLIKEQFVEICKHNEDVCKINNSMFNLLKVVMMFTLTFI